MLFEDKQNLFKKWNEVKTIKVLQKLTEFEQFAFYNIQVIVIGT